MAKHNPNKRRPKKARIARKKGGKPEGRPIVRRLRDESAPIRLMNGSAQEFPVGMWVYVDIDDDCPWQGQNKGVISNILRENRNCKRNGAPALWELEGVDVPEETVIPEGWPRITLNKDATDPMNFRIRDMCYWFYPGSTQTTFYPEDREAVIQWCETRNARVPGLFHILRGPEDGGGPASKAEVPLGAPSNLTDPSNQPLPVAWHR